MLIVIFFFFFWGGGQTEVSKGLHSSILDTHSYENCTMNAENVNEKFLEDKSIK